MMYTKSQSQLADVTFEMMRACTIAAARALSASMVHGVSFWARLASTQAALRATEANPPPVVESDPSAGQAPRIDTGADTAFSSYRSSGGHAVAQVIVPAD